MEPTPTLKSCLITILTIRRDLFGDDLRIPIGYGMGKRIAALVVASRLLPRYSESEFSRDGKKHPNDVRSEVIRAILLVCRIVDRSEDALADILLLPADEIMRVLQRRRSGSPCEHLVASLCQIHQTMDILPADAHGAVLTGDQVVDVRTYEPTPQLSSWLLRADQHPHLSVSRRRGGGTLRLFRFHRDRMAVSVDEHYGLRAVSPHRFVTRKPVAIDPPAHDSERCLLLALHGASAAEFGDTMEPNALARIAAEGVSRQQLEFGLVEIDVRRTRCT